MGRPPCCDKANVKRGLWTAEEDAKILVYVSKHGTGNWTLVPKKAGLNRCGKSCRLRWTNYLRPDLKHDSFSTEEEKLIIHLHQVLGSRWCVIAKHLPGRTDNDVKNYWNTKLRKKLMKMGIDPVTHKPISQIVSDYNYTISTGLPKLSPDQFDTAPTLQSPDTHFNLVGNPSMADRETNTNFYGLPSWNLPQLHSFMNEITSSCLGSPSLSSTTVSTMNLSSQEPTPFVPFQAQMATYPPLSTLPRVSRTFMKTLEPELAQEHGGGLVTPMNQCEVFNSSSSNGDAFVDALLDQDSLIQSEIGELLHGILDD